MGDVPNQKGVIVAHQPVLITVDSHRAAQPPVGGMKGMSMMAPPVTQAMRSETMDQL